MPRHPFAESVADRSVRRASLALWVRILPASLLGLALAEFCVMLLIERLGLPRGWRTGMLDATLLALLILPGIYVIVLRPVASLAAQLAAASADARFRAVVEATGDAIVIGDLAGHIRYANPAALRLLGYREGELEGADVTVLVPEDLRERHREGLRRFCETGELQLLNGPPVEMEALAKDATRIPIELSLSKPSGQDETLLVAVVRDVREHRRLGLFRALLPVCCVCGTIRDDTGRAPGEGDWSSLESYVARHASVGYSHTFCPGCLERYRRDQALAPATARHSA